MIGMESQEMYFERGWKEDVCMFQGFKFNRMSMATMVLGVGVSNY